VYVCGDVSTIISLTHTCSPLYGPRGRLSVHSGYVSCPEKPLGSPETGWCFRSSGRKWAGKIHNCARIPFMPPCSRPVNETSRFREHHGIPAFVVFPPRFSIVSGSGGTPFLGVLVLVNSTPERPRRFSSGSCLQTRAPARFVPTAVGASLVFFAPKKP